MINYNFNIIDFVVGISIVATNTIFNKFPFENCNLFYITYLFKSMIQRFQSKAKFTFRESQNVLLCSVSSEILPIPIYYQLLHIFS